jgi:hypothetical protein
MMYKLSLCHISLPNVDGPSPTEANPRSITTAFISCGCPIRIASRALVGTKKSSHLSFESTWIYFGWIASLYFNLWWEGYYLRLSFARICWEEARNKNYEKVKALGSSRLRSKPSQSSTLVLQHSWFGFVKNNILLVFDIVIAEAVCESAQLLTQPLLILHDPDDKLCNYSATKQFMACSGSTDKKLYDIQVRYTVAMPIENSLFQRVVCPNWNQVWWMAWPHGC